MSTDVLTLHLQGLRATDSNSLLRLYDQAQEIFTKSRLQQERTKAGQAIERIAKELEKRKVRFAPGHQGAAPEGVSSSTSSTLTRK